MQERRLKEAEEKRRKEEEEELEREQQELERRKAVQKARSLSFDKRRKKKEAEELKREEDRLTMEHAAKRADAEARQREADARQRERLNSEGMSVSSDDILDEERRKAEALVASAEALGQAELSAASELDLNSPEQVHCRVAAVEEPGNRRGHRRVTVGGTVA